MQDLRLVGVHEDGQHLLLSGPEGQRFRLALDEALRAAARFDRPRLGQLQIEMEGGARPREVQALVRSGLTTEEVSDRTGWTIERVRKFEGAVLDERRHISDLGRVARVAAAGPTLEERVAARMTRREVDPTTVQWDAWRREASAWTLVMTFAAGGRQRQARWSFVVATRTLTPLDDEARWLSEDDPAGSVLTGGVAVHTQTRVYDLEAEGGLQPRRRRAHDPVDLVSAMRERSRGRRGTRRSPTPSDVPGADLVPPDALPLEDLGYDPQVHGAPPAAHPRLGVADSSPHAHGAADEAEASDAADADLQARAAAETAIVDDADLVAPEQDLAPGGPDGHDGHDLHDLHDLHDEERAIPDEALAASEDAPAPSDDASTTDLEGDEPSAATEPAVPTRRPRRPSVPSWDDIVFGTRSRAADD